MCEVTSKVSAFENPFRGPVLTRDEFEPWCSEHRMMATRTRGTVLVTRLSGAMVIVDPSIQFVINLLEHFAQKQNVPNARDHLNRLLPTDAIIVVKMAAPIDCWAVYEMLCSHTQLVIKTLTILTTATSICSYLKSLLPVLLGTEIDSLKCDVYPLECRDRLLAEIASDNEDAGNDEESSDVAQTYRSNLIHAMRMGWGRSCQGLCLSQIWSVARTYPILLMVAL
jgi:hypothetical protein